MALKNPTASAGFEPANLGTKGQHAASRPPKPISGSYTEINTGALNMQSPELAVKLEQCKNIHKEYILYIFFWVIPRHVNFIWRRFGTLCLFNLHRHLLAYEDGTDRVFRNVGI